MKKIILNRKRVLKPNLALWHNFLHPTTLQSELHIAKSSDDTLSTPSPSQYIIWMASLHKKRIIVSIFTFDFKFWIHNMLHVNVKVCKKVLNETNSGLRSWKNVKTLDISRWISYQKSTFIDCQFSRLFYPFQNVNSLKNVKLSKGLKATMLLANVYLDSSRPFCNSLFLTQIAFWM